MDESRNERLARNEAAFRKVNEAITEVEDGRGAYLCECGALGCNRLVELSRDEYESVRANPRRFFVLPGHELPEVESIVERHDDYFVVEKHPGEADLVEATDPRS